MKYYTIEIDTYILDVSVSGNQDLDGTFTATCLHEGDKLSINGWLAESIEEMSELESSSFIYA